MKNTTNITIKLKYKIKKLAVQARLKKKRVLFTIKAIIIGIMLNTAKHAVALYLDITDVNEDNSYYYLHVSLAVMIVLVFEASILTLMRILPMIKERKNRKMIRCMLAFLTLVILSTNLLNDNIILKTHEVFNSDKGFKELSQDINVLFGTLLYSVYYSVGILFFAVISNVVSRTLSPMEELEKKVDTISKETATKDKTIEEKQAEIKKVQDKLKESQGIASNANKEITDLKNSLKEKEASLTNLQVKYNEAVKDRLCTTCGHLFYDKAQLNRAHKDGQTACKAGTCIGQKETKNKQTEIA